MGRFGVVLYNEGCALTVQRRGGFYIRPCNIWRKIHITVWP